MAIFQYGLVYRPAGIGAVPNITHQVLPPLTDEEGQRLTRHGIFATERPLTTKEIVAFDLAVLADETIKEEMAATVAQIMSEYAVEYVDEAHNEPKQFQITVMQRARKVKPYQVYLGEISAFAERVKRRLEAKVGALESAAC